MKELPDLAVRREQPLTMSRERILRWLKDIKIPGEIWEKKTNAERLNLAREGYGEITIKRERHHLGKLTDEDRALEFVKLYREFTRVLWTRMQIRTMEPEYAPQLTLAPATTEEGIVFAELLHQFGLPAPKLIFEHEIDPRKRDRLAQLHAEVLQTGHASEGVVRLHDMQPDRVDYDSLVLHAFNARPQRIYVPYGSGRLMNNFLYWQEQILSDAEHRQPDSRLRVASSDVVAMSVCAGEPEIHQPKTPFDPFATFSEADVKAMNDTGKYTGRRRVTGAQLLAAFELLDKHGVEVVTPSAAAGMALYMNDIASGNLDKNAKIVVVIR